MILYEQNASDIISHYPGIINRCSELCEKYSQLLKRNDVEGFISALSPFTRALLTWFLQEIAGIDVLSQLTFLSNRLLSTRNFNIKGIVIPDNIQYVSETSVWFNSAYSVVVDGNPDFEGMNFLNGTAYVIAFSDKFKGNRFIGTGSKPSVFLLPSSIEIIEGIEYSVKKIITPKHPIKIPKGSSVKDIIQFVSDNEYNSMIDTLKNGGTIK